MISHIFFFFFYMRTQLVSHGCKKNTAAAATCSQSIHLLSVSPLYSFLTFLFFIPGKMVFRGHSIPVSECIYLRMCSLRCPGRKKKKGVTQTEELKF